MTDSPASCARGSRRGSAQAGRSRSSLDFGVPRRAGIVLPICLTLLAAACGGEDAGARGTRRMADTLSAMHARALASPQQNTFMNRARADFIARQIAKEANFDPQATTCSRRSASPLGRRARRSPSSKGS
jgi:hypothetical protein